MRYPFNTQRRPGRAHRGRRGFTLIESAMVTVIIGVGVVGMLQLLAVGTVSNSEGTELTTAINLANNIREISLGLAWFDPQDTHAGTAADPKQWNMKEASVAQYDNITDLDACTFSPPIDVRRQPITEYGTWKQVVTVQSVPRGNVSAAPLPVNTTLEPTVRVTVTIQRSNTPVYTMSWLAVSPTKLPSDE